jgi:hypothetical protein
VKLDGRYRQHERSVLVVVDSGKRVALLEEDRYVPAYLGTFGWTGVDLADDTDWGEVDELLDTSYQTYGRAAQGCCARLRRIARGSADTAFTTLPATLLRHDQWRSNMLRWPHPVMSR